MTRPPLPALDEIERAIRPLANAEQPLAAIVLAPAAGLESPVAVLSGAFDPPTRAHAAVARATLRGGARVLLFCIAIDTIGKENRAWASLPTRLRMLCAYARGRRRVGVVVCNRGLYLEQARALASIGVRMPAFVIGFDKVPQLFDARYYLDRDAALGQLFNQARFLVVPRDQQGDAELTAFLRAADHERYADALVSLALTAAEQAQAQGVSSTQVRERAASGHPWEALLPPEARSLARRSGAYRPFDASERPITTDR